MYPTTYVGILVAVQHACITFSIVFDCCYFNLDLLIHSRIFIHEWYRTEKYEEDIEYWFFKTRHDTRQYCSTAVRDNWQWNASVYFVVSLWLRIATLIEEVQGWGWKIWGVGNQHSSFYLVVLIAIRTRISSHRAIHG